MTFKMPAYMFYPEDIIIEERKTAISNLRLPENWQGLVKNFYSENRKEKVEEYSSRMNLIHKEDLPALEIRLNWHDTNGLTDVSLTSQQGFTLNRNEFQEHNASGFYSYIGSSIIRKYICELLKSE